jgi:DNA-binding protein Fis
MTTTTTTTTNSKTINNITTTTIIVTTTIVTKTTELSNDVKNLVRFYIKQFQIKDIKDMKDMKNEIEEKILNINMKIKKKLERKELMKINFPEESTYYPICIDGVECYDFEDMIMVFNMPIMAYIKEKEGLFKKLDNINGELISSIKTKK